MASPTSSNDCSNRPVIGCWLGLVPLPGLPAAGVLAKIDDAEIDVDGQRAAIRASLGAGRKPSFRDLIGSNGRLKPVVLAAIGFMILNQFT